MDYISKTTRVIPDFATERKAASTLSHISRGWIPVDPQTLSSAQKAASGKETERSKIIETVKTDLSLLCHVTKQMRNRMEEPEPVLNPLRELESLSDEDFEALFTVSPGKISSHRISACGKVKSRILRTTLLSSNAAEVIGDEAYRSDLPVDSLAAFSCVAYRGLGWNLIAWNYPELMSSVLRAGKNRPEDASRQLQRILGTTPEKLSRHFAKEWMLDKDIRDAIGDKNGLLTSDVSRRALTTKLLIDVCEVGEAYGRIAEGTPTKQDEKAWEEKGRALKILAPDLGLTVLQNRVTERTGDALERLGHAIRRDRPVYFDAAPVRHQNAPVAKRSMDANVYLQRCPESVRKEFESVYEAIQGTDASIAALQSLINQAIPAAGFSGGCIYLINEKRATLVPAVRLGRMSPEKEPNLRPLLESTAFDFFRSNVPFRKQATTDAGTVLEHVCAAFGDAEHPGVLLLEVDQDLAEKPNHDSTLHFKAVRQCLQDCLAIS